RRTERVAYRTKFYSNLSSPTRFDEEPDFPPTQNIIEPIFYPAALIDIKATGCFLSLDVKKQVLQFLPFSI
ncbi:hypothetical protein P7D43_22565, partial [Enterococcus avium]